MVSMELIAEILIEGLVMFSTLLAGGVGLAFGVIGAIGLWSACSDGPISIKVDCYEHDVCADEEEDSDE